MTDEPKSLGRAREAAEVLGVSRSAFNAMRLRDTYIYDPVTESLTKIDPDRSDLQEYLKDKHLVTLAFAGRRPAGGRWEYNLERLRQYRRCGWPGAEYPAAGSVDE